MNKKLLLAAGAALTATTIYSTSLTAATATGNATVKVLTPLSITSTTTMNFGDVAGDANNATTVTLDSGGGTTASAGANAAGAPLPGGFDVTGDGSLGYNITLPGSVNLTGVGTGTTVSVDTFETSVGISSSLTTGSDSFTVGAVLHINAGQLADTYNGTYNMIVEYQ